MESMHQIVVQIAKVQLLKVPFAVKRLKVHHLRVQLLKMQLPKVQLLKVPFAVKRLKTL